MNKTYKEMMRDVADHEGIPHAVLDILFNEEKCINCYEGIKFFISDDRRSFYKIMAECGDEMEVAKS